MKHFPKTFILICVALTAALPLVAESLRDVALEAEKAINELPEGFFREEALNEFRRIYHSDKSVDQKIELIRSTFLSTSDTKDQSQQKESVPAFDYSLLIYRIPLRWTPHSIEIAYDINSKTEILLSSATIRQEEDNKKRGDSSGLSNSNNQNKGSSNQYSASASVDVHTPSSRGGVLGLLDWFQAKLGFQWANNHQSSEQESKIKSTQWDESAQRAWRNLFEEKSQTIKNTTVSNCHLVFTITFYNNTDSDMSFNPQVVSIPIYAGNKHVTTATPFDPNGRLLEKFNIDANATADQQFRANLNSTSALQLIDYMQNNAPGIRVESGQLRISSDDGIYKNAIQESRQDRTVPFRCPDLGLELQILRYHKANGKQTTVNDAMLAVNSIFEKEPFEFSDGACTSLTGLPLNTPNKDTNLRQLPVIAVNGALTSNVISKDILSQPISGDGLSITVANLLDDNDAWRNASDKMLIHFTSIVKAVAESGGAEAAFRLGDLYASGVGVELNKPEAVRWFTKAADLGNPEAQVRLGNSYFSGIGCNKDQEEAVKWYTEAAEQGYAQAEYNLAKCLEYSYGCAKNEANAVNWLKKAAEHGNAFAQYELGNLYYSGKRVEQDYEKAAELYQKSAEQGLDTAQCALGDCFYRGVGRRRNDYEAERWYRKAAEQNNSTAQFRLGEFYEKGIGGLSQDMTQAWQWWFKAAEQSDPQAEYRLGQLYENSNDRQKAFTYYDLSAKHGNAEAQLFFGNQYYQQQNYEVAAYWYQRAAEQGNPNAEWAYGSCLYHGIGVRSNPTEGISWIRKAAEHGNAEAQFYVGKQYYQQENYLLATYWLQKAAEQGNPDAEWAYGYYLYYNGRNITEGMNWIRKAAEHGNTEAIRALQNRR